MPPKVTNEENVKKPYGSEIIEESYESAKPYLRKFAGSKDIESKSNEGGGQSITGPQYNNNQQQEEGWLSLFSNLGSYITNMFGKIFRKVPEQSENANDTRQIELDRASKLILEKTEKVMKNNSRESNQSLSEVIAELNNILAEPIPRNYKAREDYYLKLIFRIIDYEVLSNKSPKEAAKEFLDYVSQEHYPIISEAYKIRSKSKQIIKKYYMAPSEEKNDNLQYINETHEFNNEGETKQELFKSNVDFINRKIQECISGKAQLDNLLEYLQNKQTDEVDNENLSQRIENIKANYYRPLEKDIEYLERLKELYEKWDINNENGLRIFRGSEDEKIEWHELTKDYQVSETDYMKINGETSEEPSTQEKSQLFFFDYELREQFKNKDELDNAALLMSNKILEVKKKQEQAKPENIDEKKEEYITRLHRLLNKQPPENSGEKKNYFIKIIYLTLDLEGLYGSSKKAAEEYTKNLNGKQEDRLYEAVKYKREIKDYIKAEQNIKLKIYANKLGIDLKNLDEETVEKYKVKAQKAHDEELLDLARQNTQDIKEREKLERLYNLWQFDENEGTIEFKGSLSHINELRDITEKPLKLEGLVDITSNYLEE